MTAARALLASPRARLAAGAALAAAALLAMPSGSELGAGAARAALAVGALALLAAWAARPRPAGADAAPRLEVAGRAALGRDAGLALVVADGRRLVVSYGAGAPRLVADLGRAPYRGEELP